MEDLRRYLERQERETYERSHRQAERQRLQREEDEQVVIAARSPPWFTSRSRPEYCDAAGVLGLLPEQKLTVVIRMLTYGSSADQVDEIARMEKSTTLEALNCPIAWQGDYWNRKCQKDIILEAVAGFDT
ncbi:hypothetical protein L3X38_015648 [Prunus dulcis]|uniref:Uncharacterized protein n=1 Tax=Prunus dulcis TaxID=3755 RepID=A0AAD4Z8E2_PRUDU|nr:hypothetical protein L3X38_015648 [Prunus dulcis]